MRKKYAEYRSAALANGLTSDQFKRACGEYAAWNAREGGRASPSPADWTSAALAVANASRLPRAQWGGILARAASRPNPAGGESSAGRALVRAEVAFEDGDYVAAQEALRTVRERIQAAWPAPWAVEMLGGPVASMAAALKRQGSKLRAQRKEEGWSRPTRRNSGDDVVYRGRYVLPAADDLRPYTFTSEVVRVRRSGPVDYVIVTKHDPGYPPFTFYDGPPSGLRWMFEHSELRVRKGGRGARINAILRALLGGFE
jgi:hypothetical protein